MSIVDAFTGEERERERRRQLERLSESLNKISREFGLSVDEINEALMVAVQRKRLQNTQRDINAINDAGVRK